jgi:hypothetical protein
MARSEDAIRRRALKRERTEEEQRKIDLKDMDIASKRRKEKKQVNDDNPDDPLKEAGAWKCPGCGNENFASRHWCNSKTCDERRPGHIAAPVKIGRGPPQSKRPHGEINYKVPSSSHPMDEEGAWVCVSCQYSNFASRATCKGEECKEKRPAHLPGRPSNKNPNNKRQRHDPETSKSLEWSKQADKATLSKNHELRKQYQETGGEDMTSEDVERAKTLIARDERKRQKRLQLKEEAAAEEDGIDQGAVPVKNSDDVIKPMPDDLVSTTKAQKKQNKSLRKRYLATDGKGMTEEEIERAKILLARDERKRAKSALMSEKKGDTTKEKLVVATDE